MAHSRISPSKLPYLAACPGRLQLVETLPPEQQNPPSGEAAITGTRRHALIAYRALNPTAPNPTEIDGEAIWSDDVRAVDKAWGYLKNNPLYIKHKEMLIEQPVEIGRFLGFEEGLVKGTADVILSNGIVLEVIDWKFGRNPVYPDSLQLKAYGIGSYYHVQDPGIVKVWLTIVQPECDPMVKSLSFHMEEVLGASK